MGLCLMFIIGSGSACLRGLSLRRTTDQAERFRQPADSGGPHGVPETARMPRLSREPTIVARAFVSAYGSRNAANRSFTPDGTKASRTLPRASTLQVRAAWRT